MVAEPSDLDAVGIVEIHPDGQRMILRRKDGLTLGIYAILGQKGQPVVACTLLVAPAASMRPVSGLVRDSGQD